MSIYSVLPPEAYLPQQELDTPEVCQCRYGYLEGHRDSQGKFTVSRIISTDPAAYLDSRYSPGGVL